MGRSFPFSIWTKHNIRLVHNQRESCHYHHFPSSYQKSILVTSSDIFLSKGKMSLRSYSFQLSEIYFCVRALKRSCFISAPGFDAANLTDNFPSVPAKTISKTTSFGIMGDYWGPLLKPPRTITALSYWEV